MTRNYRLLLLIRLRFEERHEDIRHVDFMWPMWHILFTTPKGRGKVWGAELEYWLPSTGFPPSPAGSIITST
jgi:hypothetical protein